MTTEDLCNVTAALNDLVQRGLVAVDAVGETDVTYRLAPSLLEPSTAR